MPNQPMMDNQHREYERPGSNLVIGLLVAGALIFALLVIATGVLNRHSQGLRLEPSRQTTELQRGGPATIPKAL
jgi:hypothetical protein